MSNPPVPARRRVIIPCVEILIVWGNSVLHTRHLCPPRSFYVGQTMSSVGRASRSCFELHVPGLETTLVPILLVRDEDSVALVLPPDAAGWVELPGSRRQTVAALLAAGSAVPCPGFDGAHTTPFPFGARAAIDAYGVTFSVSFGDGMGRLPSAARLDRVLLPCLVGAAVFHL